MPELPRVSIVGRVNVGKSRLFNRLTESQRALVTPIPGTTRDANQALVSWRGFDFWLVDTGGLTLGDRTPIEAAVLKQTELALDNSEVILFVVDGRRELTAEDYAAAKRLRLARCPVVLAVNKIETDQAERSFPPEIWRLGFGDPQFVSAMSGRGSGDLLDAVVGHLKRPAGLAPNHKLEGLKISFVGRPNVGKSSLVNALLNNERVLVSPEPYTTRDIQEIPFTWEQKPFVLVDTAGLRKRNRLAPKSIEAVSARQSETAIKNAQVVILVIDATELVTGQDRAIVDQVRLSDKCLVIAANKWDLIPDKTPTTIEDYRRTILKRLAFVTWAPIVFVSAKTKLRTHEPLVSALAAWDNYHRVLAPETLQSILRQAVTRHPPTRGRGLRYPKIHRLEQTATAPPCFRLTIGTRDSLHPAYLSFVERTLREMVDFSGTPIHLSIKKHSPQ